MISPIKSLFFIAVLLTLTSCANAKTPYISDAQEPCDLPPSRRYTTVLMALRDELPRHPYTGEFYLCQSPGQVAALQRDLLGFTLRHAAETYTAPVKDWPSLTWSHRRSDDVLATRVSLDIESQTADTMTTVLHIGHQSPNLTQVRHTFRRQGSSWTLLRREEGPEIQRTVTRSRAEEQTLLRTLPSLLLRPLAVNRVPRPLSRACTAPA